MKAKKRLPISQRCSSSFSFTSTFFFLNHNPSFFFFIQSFSHIPHTPKTSSNTSPHNFFPTSTLAFSLSLQSRLPLPPPSLYFLFIHTWGSLCPSEVFGPWLWAFTAHTHHNNCYVCSISCLLFILFVRVSFFFVFSAVP